MNPTHASQVPAWDDLTDEQRRQYRGNTDPWEGPVDPQAQAAQDRRVLNAWGLQDFDPCGCWAPDCAECGARTASGERPPKGHRRAWALRQDAALQRAKEAGARLTR